MLPSLSGRRRSTGEAVTVAGIDNALVPGGILMSRRRSTLDAHVSGEASDAVPHQGLSAAIKKCSQRFDLEIVFKLDLASAGLTHIPVLSECSNLRELDLSRNSIVRMENLSALPQLTKLVLSCNQIAAIDDVGSLPQLQHLALEDNRIAALESLSLPQLASLPKLRTLLLQGLDRSRANPVCRLTTYKSAILSCLPKLINLDGEREPHTSDYMALSEEARVIEARNGPLPPLPLPEVARWQITDPQQPSDAAAGAHHEQTDSLQVVFGGRDALLIKEVDQCRMLLKVFTKEMMGLEENLLKAGDGGSGNLARKKT